MLISKEVVIPGKQNLASALNKGFCMACENER